MSNPVEYVAGFVFDKSHERVILIRKNRPTWQAGRLNGVGGHIEPGESSLEAMRREFEEESGCDLDQWSAFATIKGPWGSVEFFRIFTDDAFNLVYSRTDEHIEKYRIAELPWDQCIPNLSWLIPLGLYVHDQYTPIVAEEIWSDGH